MALIQTLKKQRGALLQFLRTHSFPGFKQMSIYEVGKFFVFSLQNGQLTTRAASISYHLFLAIFPGIIFLFTLIPYLPIKNLDVEILSILANFMPSYSYKTFESTILDIVSNQRGGLLSISIFSTIYFATNGISNLINTFNNSLLIKDKQSWWYSKLISFFLTIIFSIVMVIGTSLIFISQAVLQYLQQYNILTGKWTIPLLLIGKWIIVLILFYFLVSLLYYAAPRKRLHWQSFSPGAIIATFLSIIISLGFSFYVNNFGHYNKFYGSLGTIVVLLLWIYLIAIALISGFELNVSIEAASKKRQKKTQKKTHLHKT
jgi:membrane protein